MKSINLPFVSLLLFLSINLLATNNDWRNIENAIGEIPDKNYCDQPYLVKAANGDWVCVITTGPGTESQAGQHIAASISNDKGKTWSSLIDIEPTNGPPASWAIPYITAYGRIYVFYVYNGDNITILKEKPLRHNSELGWYCFKYSDDNGKTWSERYRIPMRKTTLDYLNPWNGDVQLFWGISKPMTLNNNMYFAFTKMAIHPQDMGEGFFYKSSNINTERDPLKLNWELLPEGDDGIFETTLGVTQEEHNIVPLNNGNIYCFLRTSEGYAAESYSRDGGKTWSEPVYARYGDGRVIKNPRACPRVFKCENGKYLLWFHNNNIKGYKGDRNPAWMSGGIEKNGRIIWSQPEILLYGEENDKMSYPDWIEENGKYWLTETQKKVARVHAIDSELLEQLWLQGSIKKITRKGLILEKRNLKNSAKIPLSNLANLKHGGFSVELLVDVENLVPGEILLDNRDASGKGVWVDVTIKRTIRIGLNDGEHQGEWDTDPGVVKQNKNQHIVLIVDGLANLFTTVVNGKHCDGGRYRLKGWNWFDKQIDDVSGERIFTVAPDFQGKVKLFRIYNRHLTTSEAIANYKFEVK